MLQRVQTIFLLCVIISMILMLFLPIWEKATGGENEGEQITLNAFYQVHSQAGDNGTEGQAEKKSTFYIAIFAVLAIAVAGTSMFKYNNRLTQIKLGALNSLLIAGAMGTSLYFAMGGEKIIDPGVQGSYQLGFFMPVAALIFNLMANRFIRKDEKLVKSVDRLR
ncbi:DUF4293 domain-containing protein [Fulvivirgaceae bacterium BMA12]|uniref:DUF4293 domain-containing protein n=1 Tax=Agaribacillus aureus TaxID=3051825 RepID=A0ABT8LE19_9BACT|nr:DUF4293 domain-containing protein [Fulvivirgaceae bacterium BMA12]